MKYAKDLRKGDKVNGHENGWMTVKTVRKGWSGVTVIYNTAFGKICKEYRDGDNKARWKICELDT